MKYTLPIVFAIGTALCWGLYGPTVANARDAQRPPRWSPFKPYVLIGCAYLVFAIGGGFVGMQIRGDSYNFTGEESPAATWGFFAGTFGALGALCLTSAMLSFEGPPKPQLVMPIVFGGAVSITAIVSTIQNRVTGNPLMWLGMVLVVVGVVLVAYFTPHGGPGHAKPASGETPHEAAVTSTADEPA